MSDTLLPHLASPYKGEGKNTADLLRLMILATNY